MPYERRATKLIDHLLAHPETSESDGVASELLSEYQRGSPIESLRILLASPDDRLVGEATWIASELPEKGKPLVHDVGMLLGHRAKKVRFWAIHCILLWAERSNGRELASAVALIDDIEMGVRWKTMEFLSLASSEQLWAAYGYLKKESPEPPLINELQWLLGTEGTGSAEIVDALQGSDARHRRFAAVAAFRIVGTDLVPLRVGASTDDHEVAQFTGDMLARVSERPNKNTTCR